MLDIMAVRFLNSKNENENDIEQFKNDYEFDIYSFITILVALLISYLAYRCNEGSGKANQIFFTIIAFLFSGIYLLFYLIYHILMGVPCP